MDQKMDFQKKDYTEEELVEIARRRIKVKRDLYSHIAAYVIVNGFLFFLSLIDNNFVLDEHFDFKWIVLAGWGVGLAFHIVSTWQELRFRYNTNAVNRELEKIKSKLK